MECIIFLIVGFTIGFIFCMIFKRCDVELKSNQVQDYVVLEYLVMKSLIPAKNMLYLELVTMLSFREMNSDYSEGGKLLSCK